jgi:transcriptional regulator with XRE-family HTH domain
MNIDFGPMSKYGTRRQIPRQHTSKPMGRERSLGRRLREARLSAGFSQSKLARASGVPKTRLSRYENDHIIPSLTTLKKIARALKVSEGALIGEERKLDEAFIAALRARGVKFASQDDVEKLADAVARVAKPRRR